MRSDRRKNQSTAAVGMMPTGGFIVAGCTALEGSAHEVGPEMRGDVPNGARNRDRRRARNVGHIRSITSWANVETKKGKLP